MHLPGLQETSSHPVCAGFDHSVTLPRTQSLYPYAESTINSNIAPHLRLTILFLLSLFITIMPCFIRLCPHYHLSEFPNAKVLLCILFGAAPLCLPMTYMKLVCSALQCGLCRLTVSFFCWALVPSRRVWIFYIPSDSSTEGHTGIPAFCPCYWNIHFSLSPHRDDASFWMTCLRCGSPWQCALLYSSHCLWYLPLTSISRYSICTEFLNTVPKEWSPIPPGNT